AGTTEPHAQHGAGRREQQAFGEELPEETPAPGAEGRAERELTMPGGGASEEQMCDVGAGHEQYEQHRTAQHGERVAKTYAIGWLRETGLERKRFGGFRVGPGGARPREDRVELARRRDRREAGAKTAQQHHANVVVVDVER